jgi:hypothetical protein
MSQIMSNYEYDIFNSYRQKDKKDRKGEREKGRKGEWEKGGKAYKDAFV